jgi:hypothetical protein
LSLRWTREDKVDMAFYKENPSYYEAM